ELERDMVCSGRALCQRQQYRATLLKAAIFIAVTDHTVSAWFVHSGVERELSAVVGGLAQWHNAPARDHLGEIRDIVLRIACSYSERVQLKDLAGEIFIEALVTTQASE